MMTIGAADLARHRHCLGLSVRLSPIQAAVRHLQAVGAVRPAATAGADLAAAAISAAAARAATGDSFGILDLGFWI